MSSLPIKTGTGAQINVSTTPLPDGSVALNHVTINADGTAVSPAQDATMQAISAQLTTLTTAFAGIVKTDPGTF